jgi:iron(III) transport system substrate-binding protein
LTAGPLGGIIYNALRTVTMTCFDIDRHPDALRWIAFPLAAIAGLLALLLSGESAPAQPSSVAAIANYQGPDRTQRLIEGAKREGALTFYSNAPTEDNTALVTAFEKTYGIKINLYRASSEDIRQRVLNEARARRFDVDLILNNAPAMEALNAEKLLHEVKSPHVADVMPNAIPSYRTWVGFCLNVLVSAYNTNLIKKADLPKSYQDLLDPKWKGKIAIEADDSDWFSGLVEAMGQEKGLKLFRDIAETNGFSVRKGHTLLTTLISAGEVPLGLTNFNYTAAQFKKKGAPLDWFTLDPLVAHPNAIALAANAPHPHAAILLFDFILTDGQKLLAARDYVVTSRKVASPLDRNTIHMLDAAQVVTEGEKWQRLYTQIITARR